MRNSYVATHELHEGNVFAYYWDMNNSVVLTKDTQQFYCHMTKEWGQLVLAGKKPLYKFKEIIICLETK